MPGRREPKKRDAAQINESVELVCHDEPRRELQTPVLSLLGIGQSRHDADYDPLVGTVIAAKYEIHALCGQGGMGSVYKAQHFDLKRFVAVKVLHKHLLSHQGISDRFRLSAQAAHALRHPNLVSVTDFGYTQEGQFYLAMDFIQGETLAYKLKREHELSVDSFFKVFSQVLSGLKFCHEKGIVHRDIKPSNILITDREVKTDSIKLVDFGIAKVLPESDSSIDHLTQTGELLGSPLYMSPEQCRGDEIDARTDLYALGCVMFEALSGKPPFQGKSAIETLMLHCSQPSPTLYEATGDAQLTEQLDAFIKKAMAKDRNDRFGSAEEMEAALASIQRFLHLPKIARQRLNQSSQGGTGSQSVQTTHPAPRSKMGFWLVTLVAIGASCGMLFLGKNALTNQAHPPLLSQQTNATTDQALDTIKLGVIERQEGNLNHSEARLRKALVEVEQAFGKQSEEYMTTLNELAASEIAIAENDATIKRKSFYQVAEVLLQSSIEGCHHLSAGLQQENELAKINMLEARATFQLAHVYTRQARYEQAANLFTRGFKLLGTDQPIDETNQEFFKAYSDYLWRVGKEREAAQLQLSFFVEPNEAKGAGQSSAVPIAPTGLWSEKNFSIELVDTSGVIRGSHSYTIPHSNRVDGTIDNTRPTITGSFTGGIYKGQVKSSSGPKANLSLVRLGDYLVWKLIPIDGEGRLQLPETAVLRLGELAPTR
ncbi:MAG: serine/threonine-protein kinase [Candidatus Melainabacteria bacterium]|nr:serine/threonine-protein kinase [Candidatus Melainabacteria bacterium]